MTPETLRALLERVQSGTLPVEAAIEALKDLPFAELGFAKIDGHRHLRTGFPEVVYGQGKTDEQLVAIGRVLLERGGAVLMTRLSPEIAQAVQSALPELVYDAAARCLYRAVEPVAAASPPVLVLTAGTLDLPVAAEAARTAAVAGCKVELISDVGVAGLHRLLAVRARLDEAAALVVVAGMEGALPSVVAGLCRRPVIAVPTSVGYGAHLAGLTPLLAMMTSCAAGVAVVNIDNGFGAGYLAAQIARQSKGASEDS